MDGNGRWAQRRGLPRLHGHRAGAAAVERTVEAAARSEEIGTLTLYAFSCENWKRPAAEVSGLMSLFSEYLRGEAERCERNGVRLQVIGRRDRLSKTLLRSVDEAERRTRLGEKLLLRLAVDYSARDAVLRAVADGPAAIDFPRALARVLHADPKTPSMDLLIRTGGERRVSDQLAWEAAYAELIFLKKMWPDFKARDLQAALREFAKRTRRFGGLSAA